jgi:hypothetical protein
VLLPVLLCSLAAPAPARSFEFTVTVDSSRHQIVIRAGPYRIPDMPPMTEQELMDHGTAHDTPLEEFEIPIDGWLRAATIRLADAGGEPVDRRILHHLIVVNLARRQLLYPAYERIFGAGAETDDVSLPKTVGVPVAAGMPLGLYLGWHNETGKSLDAVYLTLSIAWTPTTQSPRPISALPIYMDVNLQVAESNTFDVPPGRSTKAYEFALPVGGRLLGVGGHLHDYGVAVRLEEASTGRVVTSIRAKQDPEGRVLSLGRKLFGVTGDGIRLVAGRRYRVVGEYDNPTGQTRIRGAMAHMVGLFVPEDLAGWPAVDSSDPWLKKDLAALVEPHARREGHRPGPPKS